MDRRPYLSACFSHSTPWSSGPLAASLAHPSATSFPGIALCAGPQRIDLDRRLPLAQGCYRLPQGLRDVLFFCSIILAFSLYRLWRHTILSSSCLPSRPESRARWQHPRPPQPAN